MTKVSYNTHQNATGAYILSGMSHVINIVFARLFPMGDMPEMLVSLISKGKAVLWSSQSKKGCKVNRLIQSTI